MPIRILGPTAVVPIAGPYGLLLSRLLDRWGWINRLQINHPADTWGLVGVPSWAGLFDTAGPVDLGYSVAPVSRHHRGGEAGPSDPQESDHYSSSQHENAGQGHCVQQGITIGQFLALNLDPPFHLPFDPGFLGGLGFLGCLFLVVAGADQIHGHEENDDPLHQAMLLPVCAWQGFEKSGISLMFMMLGLVVGWF